MKCTQCKTPILFAVFNSCSTALPTVNALCLDCSRKIEIANKSTGTKKMKHSELKYINLIGVELEGGWSSSNGRTIVPDGSVRVMSAPYKGEVQSKPSTLENLEGFVFQHAPPFIDNSCGLHVHVSFKDKVGSFLALMDDSFWQLFQKRMFEWGKKEKLPENHQFWSRLRGDNRFCKKMFQPSNQINLMQKSETRYTQLNYCYAMHGTIECRLFPAFSEPAKIMSAVYALVSCYEEFLDIHLSKITKEFTDIIYESDFMEV